MMIAMDPSFKQVLKKNELNDFDALWAIEGELVETGNMKQKSGHSHVLRLSLPTDALPMLVYMKKQSHYATTFSRLLRRMRSICCREYENITAWHRLGLPTLDALYCGEVQHPLRGILITAALEGYQPLDDYLQSASPEDRLIVLEKTGQLLRRIHQAGWIHRCFFPKHVFVNMNNPIPLKMIDLEKAKKRWAWIYDNVRDLSAFDRRLSWRDDMERMHFFDAYFGNASMTGLRRAIMMLVGKRSERKRRNRNAHWDAKGNQNT